MTLQVPGDELKWVRCCTNSDLVAMASQNGMVILSSCEIVSSITLFSFVFKLDAGHNVFKILILFHLFLVIHDFAS